MRYTQDSGVRRKGGDEEYKVVVSVYLTPAERDLWGSGRVRLGLLTRGNCPLPDGDDLPFTAPQHDLHEAGYRDHDPATCRDGDHYGQCSGATR